MSKFYRAWSSLPSHPGWGSGIAGMRKPRLPEEFHLKEVGAEKPPVLQNYASAAPHDCDGSIKPINWRYGVSPEMLELL